MAPRAGSGATGAPSVRPTNMTWLDRLLGGGSLPSWSPFDRARHVLFLRCVRDSIRGVMKLHAAMLAAGTIALPSGKSWDLIALARRLERTDSELWFQAVDDDLARLLRVEPEPTARALAALLVEQPGRLRTQLWSRESPLPVEIALDTAVHRTLVGPLVEVAVWDADGAGAFVAHRGEGAICGLDDTEVLRRGRLEAIAATPKVRMVPLAIAGFDVDIVTCESRYLGACMLEALTRLDAGEIQVVIPVSWRHWIFHRVEAEPSPAALAVLRDLARTILDGAPAHECIGDAAYLAGPSGLASS